MNKLIKKIIVILILTLSLAIPTYAEKEDPDLHLSVQTTNNVIGTIFNHSDK